MKNYDLNIWDYASYETSGRVTGLWKVNAYGIPYAGAGYGMGSMLEEEFFLTPTQVKMLDLDSGDDDFWVDAESLLEGRLVPRRLRRWLESLSKEGL